MQIIGLPLLSDNYAWLLVDAQQRECAVVDPSEAAPVAAAIQGRGLRLRCILATHHHPDHTGGIAALADDDVQVIASDYDRQRVPRVTHAVGDNTELSIIGQTMRCMMVPGHTLGAVAFYFPALGALFTGDTLFTAGCGRLFEGDAVQMHTSLCRLAALPPETAVYCGHEYTEKNLQFAASLEPNNEAVARRRAAVAAQRQAGMPTVPATLAEERQTNPFLRCEAPALREITGEKLAVDVFAALRRRRDAF